MEVKICPSSGPAPLDLDVCEPAYWDAVRDDCEVWAVLAYLAHPFFDAGGLAYVDANYAAGCGFFLGFDAFQEVWLSRGGPHVNSLRNCLIHSTIARGSRWTDRVPAARTVRVCRSSSRATRSSGARRSRA